MFQPPNAKEVQEWASKAKKIIKVIAKIYFPIEEWAQICISKQRILQNLADLEGIS